MLSWPTRPPVWGPLSHAICVCDQGLSSPGHLAWDGSPGLKQGVYCCAGNLHTPRPAGSPADRKSPKPSGDAEPSRRRTRSRKDGERRGHSSREGGSGLRSHREGRGPACPAACGLRSALHVPGLVSRPACWAGSWGCSSVISAPGSDPVKLPSSPGWALLVPYLGNICSHPQATVSQLHPPTRKRQEGRGGAQSLSRARKGHHG